jgi:glycosyltransferase involved in cell wall biosynthesis
VLTFLGYFDPLDGYGYATIKIAAELKRLRPDTQIVNMRDNEAEGDDRRWHVEGTALALCTPDWLPNIEADLIVSHTMFETDRLPAHWVVKLNRAARIVVPCPWCADVFRSNGVDRPIDLALWGVDRLDYYPLQRVRHEAYTFLWSGTADLRKGWDVAYRAFDLAFRDRQGVDLVLHFRDPLPVAMRFTDSNVKVIVGRRDRPALREMLRRADCFIFPSRGEGWGLPPREAAATGLPVIATNYGGLAVEIDQWAIPLPVVGMSSAGYGWWTDIGQWAEPSVERLAEEMLECFANEQAAQERAALAALWLRRNTPWSRTAQALLEAVDRTERQEA